jgi:hypothetical protein
MPVPVRFRPYKPHCCSLGADHSGFDPGTEVVTKESVPASPVGSSLPSNWRRLVVNEQKTQVSYSGAGDVAYGASAVPGDVRCLPFRIMGRFESPLCSRENTDTVSVGMVHPSRARHMQGPVGFIPVPVIDAVGVVRGFLNFRKNNVLTMA